VIKLSESIPKNQAVSNDAQLIAAAILTLQMSTVNAVATVDELIEILFGDCLGHDEIE
jgi:hypothetical protein